MENMVDIFEAKQEYSLGGLTPTEAHAAVLRPEYCVEIQVRADARCRWGHTWYRVVDGRLKQWQANWDSSG